MSARRLAWAALLGLSTLGRPTLAQEPGRLVPPTVNYNQTLADTITEQLRQSAVLRRYNVDVSVNVGDVLLRGSVTSQSQREEVLRLVQGVPGVARVVDQMTIAGQSASITPVQGPALPPALPDPTPGSSGPIIAPPPSSLPPVIPPPPTPGSPGTSSAPMTPGVIIPGTPTMPGGNRPGMIPDPVPLSRSPGGAYSELNPPRMPPYAWPTYAPYNNFSRVGTPTAMPWQSFPFIGPAYPFPKVPLGWRSVKLTWDDGYWWYGQVGNKYNWWKIRYW